MLIQQTTQGMRALRLNAMAEGFEQQRNNPTLQELSFEDRLGMLVDHELQARNTRRVTRLIKDGKLKANDAAVEDIDFHASRGLDKRLMTSLMAGDWVTKGQNIIFTGPTGVGKTWLALEFRSGGFSLALPNRLRRLRRRRWIWLLPSA